MVEVGVVDLLVAVERLVAEHCDELDILNVFPVPDADTGRNVLATVRAARVAGELAPAGGSGHAAAVAAVRGARGNAGTLTSQLLRALLEEDPGGAPPSGWPARLARADELARAAVAHPVEGSFLTALRDAAVAAAGPAEPDEQLAAAAAAAHAAVDRSPGQLEVLARAGVVDAGARAAALVLEAVAAAVAGTAPAPPDVEVPATRPDVLGCDVDEHAYEVMYLVEPHGTDDLDDLREELAAIGGSVVVAAADRLVSVHVHTDDIGAVLDVGLGHGRPHHIRVEDLAASTDRVGVGDRRPPLHVGGLVVGAGGLGIAAMAADLGATTLPVPTSPGAELAELEAAVRRTGRDRVLVLPGEERLARASADLEVAGVDVEVVAEVDGPAEVVAALAVLDPSAPAPAQLAVAAGEVRSGMVVAAPDGAWVARLGRDVVRARSALGALEALGAAIDVGAAPELVSLLLGADVGVALRRAAAAALARRWPDAEVEVLDAELATATFVVGVE